MNEKHLNWCRSHDWGRNATLSGGKIYFQDLDGENQVFESFSKLKNWAGY